MPVHAMRVFNFAMTVSDLNNLVDLTVRRRDSQGWAYIADVSNNGVYKRQRAVTREGDCSGNQGNIRVSKIRGAAE